VPPRPQLRTIRWAAMFCADADRAKLAAMAKLRQMNTKRCRPRDFMFWGLGGLGSRGLTQVNLLMIPGCKKNLRDAAENFSWSEMHSCERCDQRTWIDRETTDPGYNFAAWPLRLS
jgi:hypothetical protein